MAVSAGGAVGLALVAAAGVGARSGVLTAVGSGLVLALLTAILLRRAASFPWWPASAVGIILGLVDAAQVIAAAPHGPGAAPIAGLLPHDPPGWLPPAFAAYAAAAGGVIAVALTRPVRRLSALLGEYAVALVAMLAAGGAAAGCLAEAELDPTARATTLVVGVGVGLVAAAVARDRLGTEPSSVGDRVFIGLFILALLVAVVAVAIIVVSTDTSLDSPAAVRVLVAVPLAFLGVGTVLRAWSPAGWWMCVPPVLGLTAAATVVAAEPPRLWADAAIGYGAGCVGGAVLTVAVAAVLGYLRRSPERRRRWRGWQAEEPARLAPLTR